MIAACPRCDGRYDVTGFPAGETLRCRCGEPFVVPALPTSVGRIECPGCGAGVPPNDTRCQFCASHLATVRCARCFALSFRGSEHCGACGAKSLVPADDWPQTVDRTCPRCERPTLAPAAIGERVFDHCRACGGDWLAEDTFLELVEGVTVRGQAADALGPKRNTAQMTVPPAGPVKYLKCPVCQAVMARRNYSGRSGVIVDVCAAHGVWFDREELPRILQFVAGGGLQRSQRDLLEKTLEEQRRVRTALRAAERETRRVRWR